jgi:AAA15 family ATPase/GTPase
MQLVSITVENFRSITAARRIPISELTTLVGPNNEGKSNILRALVIATNTLLRLSENPVRVPPRIRRTGRRYYGLINAYDWDTDFPLHLRASNLKKTKSSITLEFSLTADERALFRERIGSQINGTLPLALDFDKDVPP